MRVGLGSDTHRLVPGGPLRLGGIDIPFDRRLEGHSDADALLHAITDAVLGAAAAGDIGELFPDDREENRGRDSAGMLTAALARARQRGWRPVNVDCIVHAQAPRLSPWKTAIAARVAELLGLAGDCVGIKAKTAEGLGPVGEGRSIEVLAVVLMARDGNGSPP